MTTMQRDLRQEATFIKMGLEQSGKSYLQALTMESGKLTRVTLIVLTAGSSMTIMWQPKNA